MIKLTKSQMESLFNGGQTYEAIAENFSTQTEMTVTPKMVREMFIANGFNLRNRKRKSPTSWFEVIDDSVGQAEYAPSYTEEVV